MTDFVSLLESVSCRVLGAISLPDMVMIRNVIPCSVAWAIEAALASAKLVKRIW